MGVVEPAPAPVSVLPASGVRVARRRLGGGAAAELGVRALTTACVLAVAAYGLSEVPGLRHPSGHSGLWDERIFPLTQLLCGVLCLVRAWRGPREQRLGGACLGVGLLFYGAGNAVWAAREGGLPGSGGPTAADTLWLAFYPCAYVGVLLLARQTRRLAPSVWLDGVVAGLGVAAYTGLLLAPALQGAMHASLGAVGVNLAYPAADLLLAAVTVAALGLQGWRPTPAVALLVAALVVFAGSDAHFLLHTDQVYLRGDWRELGWVLAPLLVALAAGRVPRRNEGAERARPLLAVPLLCTWAALALLGYDHVAHAPAVPAALALATVVAATVRMLWTLREVRALARSRELARTDDLTGLPNRRAFYDGARALLGDGDLANRALLLLDLNRFKEVNDTLGHLAGDQLLTAVARRLHNLTRPGDLLARLGGDEFALLLATATRHEAQRVADEIRRAMSAPVQVERMALQVDASVGIALAPAHGMDVSALLRCADIAMYRAKADSSGHRVYDSSCDDNTAVRLQTIDELRHAIDAGELVLHYQPKVELVNGAVYSVEALVRWQHPTRGLLGPGAFLPLAETSGQMLALTGRVLDMALDQAQAWWRAGTPLAVAVNLPVSMLLDVTLPERIAGALAQRGLPAAALQVEITEELLMSDRERSQGVLSRLRRVGVKIALDDFGTGYSSLAYLRELPVDELKLDRSFVSPIGTDARAAALVRSTVDLAHSLGLRMVAEGVETRTVLDALCRYGCDQAQGFYLSRPVPAAELDAWLLARRGGGSRNTVVSRRLSAAG